MKISKNYLKQIIKEEIIHEQKRIISENILKDLYNKIISLRKKSGEGSSFNDIEQATQNWAKQRKSSKTTEERIEIFANNFAPIIEKLKKELEEAQKQEEMTPIIQIDDPKAMSVIKTVIKQKYGDLPLQELEKDMSLYEPELEKVGNIPLF